MAEKKIAIACQGGGSHTAFTAGVLKRILEEKDIKIVGLSGTSGGAICATIAWYSLVTQQKETGGKLLEAFWMDNAATEFWDVYLNKWLVGMSRLRDYISMPEMSPYNLPDWGHRKLKELIEKYVDFSKLNTLKNKNDIGLYVGAVEVHTGCFKVFDSESISVDAVLASAAIPTLFKAINIGGGLYWDGLFSENPPVRILHNVDPQEIWIIQINPIIWLNEPVTVQEITDRRNELSGNLSLNQEVYFIETMNKLIRNNIVDGKKYKPIEVKRILMSDKYYALDYSSKLDRDSGFIAGLIEDGYSQADKFLKKIG